MRISYTIQEYKPKCFQKQDNYRFKKEVFRHSKMEFTPEKSYFDLKKCLDCFFIEFKKWMSAQSHKCNVINTNIFFSLKKKLSSFKLIKLNNLFLKFLPVFYLNQINMPLNKKKC